MESKTCTRKPVILSICSVIHSAWLSSLGCLWPNIAAENPAIHVCSRQEAGESEEKRKERSTLELPDPLYGVCSVHCFPPLPYLQQLLHMFPQLK